MDRRRMARVYAALGNEVRLRIVELVSAHREMCVCELVDQLGMSQANISRHVGILRDAGLLQDRKVGAWVLLRVDEDALHDALGRAILMVREAHRASAQMDPEKRLAGRCEVAHAE